MSFICMFPSKMSEYVLTSEIEKNMLKKTYDPMSIQTFHMSGKY
jgi:hypothetical protein